jgi:alanine-synthesizing transaminase
MQEFSRLKRLPSYMFNEVNTLKMDLRHAGRDIIDFGMGNPDRATPTHIVDKLCETAQRGDTHRYSASRGIPRLRLAMKNWYQNRFGVELSEDREVIVTIGSKEGLSHLALAMTEPGDTALVPNPSYPIHIYGFAIAGASIQYLSIEEEEVFLADLERSLIDVKPRPKVLVLNFPANPTAMCVELPFFEKIIALAKKYQIWVIHDFAYADIAFDGYQPPSILQVKGARELAVETYSLSKSYNMPGWRVGFVCGNEKLVKALSHLKSYMDYGTFTPIQVAAITALEGSQECVKDITELYRKRRDVLCQGLNSIGWQVESPKATMFVWAKIPEQFREMGSLSFAKFLMNDAEVAVAPGIGFGSYGDEYVRFGLIENEARTRQAIRNLRQLFQKSHC